MEVIEDIMIINEEGEVISVDEEDFRRAKKNPYAEKLKQAEKLYRGTTVVIDTEVVTFFKELSKTKGGHHSTLMSEILKDYITNMQQEKEINRPIL